MRGRLRDIRGILWEGPHAYHSGRTPRAIPVVCRRWQGVALAVWGAAASLTARGCPDGTLECYRLLSSFLRVPAVCDLALATPAGRSTVLQVYESMLSVSEWTEQVCTLL